MRATVTVQIDGVDVLAGHLYQQLRHGDETASMRSCFESGVEQLVRLSRTR